MSISSLPLFKDQAKNLEDPGISDETDPTITRSEMANIALVNFDEIGSSDVANALRRLHHSVSVLPIETAYEAIVKTMKSSPELIILDFAYNEPEARALVRRITSCWISTGHLGIILCILHVYRGPRLQVDLEREGARVIYAS